MGEMLRWMRCQTLSFTPGLSLPTGCTIVVALGRFPSAAPPAPTPGTMVARLLCLLLRFEQDVDLVVVDLLRRLARVVLRVVVRVQNLETRRRGGAGDGRSDRTSRTRRRDRDGGTVPPDFSRRARGPTRERGEEGTHHCSSSPSRSDTSLGTRRHFSHESHWTHASEHKGLSSASSAAEGPSPSSSAMVAAPAYEIGPLGVATAIVRDARTRGIERDARGGSIGARGSIAGATRRVTPRTGVGPARHGMASSRPRRPFSNGERRSGRSGEDSARRMKNASRAEKCASRAGTSARSEERSGARRDVSSDQNRTVRRRTPFLRRACYHTMMSYTSTETKTRDRDVTGSNPPVSLEPRAKRQHPRRRFPRRSRRRPDRRPRHANPRAPVFRGARRSATKPIQNPRNNAAR